MVGLIRYPLEVSVKARLSTLDWTVDWTHRLSFRISRRSNIVQSSSWIDAAVLNSAIIYSIFKLIYDYREALKLLSRDGHVPLPS